MTLPKIIRALLRLRGFTLIEMLAVIAIIGILAGLLIPAVVMVKRKARVAKAHSDIAGLSMAIEAYIADFGAPPPDSNDALDGSGRDDLKTPNQCLFWFLTREYNKNMTPTDFDANDAKDVDALNARIQSAAYFGADTKSRRDYYGDGIDEFVDPWGRPYMYRAWVESWAGITGSVDAVNDLELDLNLPSNREGMDGIIGRIELRGFTLDRFNGTFDFVGFSTREIRISFNSAIGGAPATAAAQYRFPLRNQKKGYDLYSLGPNGITRAVGRPLESGDVREWKPWTDGPPLDIDAERDKWEDVWGTPGDGNDTTTNGNMIDSEKDKDDICNW